MSSFVPRVSRSWTSPSKLPAIDQCWDPLIVIVASRASPYLSVMILDSRSWLNDASPVGPWACSARVTTSSCSATMVRCSVIVLSSAAHSDVQQSSACTSIGMAIRAGPLAPSNGKARQSTLLGTRPTCCSSTRVSSKFAMSRLVDSHRSYPATMSAAYGMVGVLRACLIHHLYLRGTDRR